MYELMVFAWLLACRRLQAVEQRWWCRATDWRDHKSVLRYNDWVGCWGLRRMSTEQHMASLQALLKRGR